ncbi:hypothetical protein [Desulfatibacillum aliphaticivorans]|uniref:hypothetical protein n=1 Tax=Desulfatibacillum aliphaticivorans TaxID=218208 RepID=UPI00042A1CE2|nr:hypothetical protein [Desulfatibacillum aliphaticivorans]
MPLIDAVDIQDAQGELEKEYLHFLTSMIEVPEHYRMFSSSVGLMKARRGLEDYYLSHSKFSFKLVCFIRLMAAHALKFEPCKIFNLRLLKTKEGLLDKWANMPLKDFKETPLPENEKAMLLFAIKSLKSPKSIKPRDLEPLRAFGYTDGDILDAAHLAAMVKTEKELFALFKMGK